jgi:hypothetical protein
VVFCAYTEAACMGCFVAASMILPLMTKLFWQNAAAEKKRENKRGVVFFIRN